MASRECGYMWWGTCTPKFTWEVAKHFCAESDGHVGPHVCHRCGSTREQGL